MDIFRNCILEKEFRVKTSLKENFNVISVHYYKNVTQRYINPKLHPKKCFVRCRDNGEENIWGGKDVKENLE